MAERPGWFGKMPALGDFASRRLPDAWIAAWDAWLQDELLRARDALGDDAWLALYLVAPVRRFWLAPGLLTHEAWLGVLMPSVDRVGRHFPFTLATPLDDGHDELVDALACDDWLGAADALARQVLDPAFDVAALERAIAQLPLPHGERRIEAHSRIALAQELHARHAQPHCVWWCEGASAVEDFRAADALPRGDAFIALLRDGA
jgi:type VI secretion system ImpM family protein